MLTPSRQMLLACCGSSRWADQMVERLPCATMEDMIAAADDIWGTLDPADWLEAFAAHPRIGQRTADQQAAREQSRVAGADNRVQERLAQATREYEARFGYIFIISAQGKSAEEMLDALERRLGNPAAEELNVAAAEQAKITRLRLGRLLT